MRFVVLAAFILILASPVATQAAGPGQKFGSITCPQKVSCSPTSDDSANIANSANQCMLQGLGLAVPSGFFDDVAGVDSSGCLTVKSEVIGKNPQQVLPHCCLVAVDESNCAFHCDMVQH
ncbi:MAG TPA: hypothetical protein VFR09_00650 [Alphaproteobacteria bacterium]|nr:hypothetical protein [Alphaproteobacteria bacterium]